MTIENPSPSTQEYGTYLATTVVRGSLKNDVHGYAYLVDLDRGEHRCVITWDDADINWAERGRERGLRGIAYHDGRVLVAAHNRVLVYDPEFTLIEEIAGPLLGNLHEIVVEDNLLYLTSTSFNAIVVYDLVAKRFVEGFWLRYTKLGKRLRKLGFRPMPKMSGFDPAGTNTPPRGGHLHINSAYRRNGATMVSGTNMGRLVAIKNNKLTSVNPIPYLTHNAREYRDGIICNDTSQHRIVRLNGGLTPTEVFDTPPHDMTNVVVDDMKKVIAVEGFARGLVTRDDGLIVGGSSPASVSAYRLGNASPLKTVKITDNVCNAVHGLAPWPF